MELVLSDEDIKCQYELAQSRLIMFSILDYIPLDDDRSTPFRAPSPTALVQIHARSVGINVPDGTRERRGLNGCQWQIAFQLDYPRYQFKGSNLSFTNGCKNAYLPPIELDS